MDLLILGGTRFLGRHVAQQALDAGHRLTLLHRGRSNPRLFAQAGHLVADRDQDLTLLEGRRWDAVIDTSAYFPRQVRSVAAALAGRVGHYQLVSSISAYAGFDAAGNDEDAPLATLVDAGVETVSGPTYGGLKALCEHAALQAFGASGLVARPGLIVGPHDPTGRFTWWVTRMQRGGTVLAPGDPDGPVQFIDARDAAAWLLLQAERGGCGVFNLTGPATPLTMAGFLDTALQTLAPAGSRLQWVEEATLLEQGVAPWTGIPVWLPAASAGLHRTRIECALATGLCCRPLAQTLADTAAWAATQAPPAGIGLPPERETTLLTG